MKNCKEKGKHTEHQISNRTEWNLQKNDIVDWVMYPTTAIKKPVPENGTSFGNHVLKDVTKMRSYWIRVGSKFNSDLKLLKFTPNNTKFGSIFALQLPNVKSGWIKNAQL